MKTTYTSFEELAKIMTDGNCRLHKHNCVFSKGEIDPCIAWQKGITGFGKWLDFMNIKVEVSDEGKEEFYNYGKEK